ncbi:MAG: hypothetical protein H0T55_01660 [Rubrobacteraceae bacterium]|nr:hypothetical protein [Rubrobacteraceae bacterium]
MISALVPALGTGGVSPGGSGSGSGSGGGEDNPLGPDNPGGPNHEWFRRGAVDPRKWDAYLFDPNHPQNEGKAKGWLDTFGVGKGDGPRVERAIREQLDQAEIVEVDAAQHAEVPGRRSRKWNLIIARFAMPGRRPAPVLTVWAQDPSEEYPHLVTAVVRP